MTNSYSIEKPIAMRLRVAVATGAERIAIARARHDVYVAELHQYAAQPDGLLRDADGVDSIYIGAWYGDELAGFIGITSPSSRKLSLDKHLSRESLPFAFDEGVFEIRSLTVLRSSRGSTTAAALMYAAMRLVQDAGGKRIVAAGRRDVLGLYLRVGLETVGVSFNSGAVTYDMISAPVERIAAQLERYETRLDRFEGRLDWRLDCDFRPPSVCYHGGACFEAIGDTFDDLERRETVIAADVLDAWYPPAPPVLETLREHAEWLARTSPPTQAAGLTQTIARARGVDEACVLPGGGSSQLIFLALQRWLNRSSRVLLLDPMYGEYAHVLEHLVGCSVERFLLDRADGYRLNVEALRSRLRAKFDWLIWVNPNNPTGGHTLRAEVERVMKDAPPGLKCWVDETYVEYAPPEQSLEYFASCSSNTVVCKSMSKVYALSGLRVGYLCGPRRFIGGLRPALPPWSVSLPAQLAATRALQSPAYYAERIAETRVLRAELAGELERLGIDECVPGIGNFVMLHLPKHGPDAARVVATCRNSGLFIRDVGATGTSLGDRAIRIAVKDRATNRRMVTILERALRPALLPQ